MSLDRNQKIIDENYLRFVRSHPCIACGVQAVDAHHVRARGAEEFKRQDYTAVPLCRKHHREIGNYGIKDFQARQVVNVYEEALYLLIEFHLMAISKLTRECLQGRNRDHGRYISTKR